MPKCHPRVKNWATEQGSQLSPSRETESVAYSESLELTTVTEEEVLWLRICMNPEFNPGAKGSGAGYHKGPSVPVVSVEIRNCRPAPRGQPEKG